jgi:hypothetical protein
MDSLRKLTRDYRRVIQAMDQRTGAQGLRFDGRRLFAAMARSAIVELMETGAIEATTHAGLNDNTISTQVAAVARLMPRTRFVFIVRDPRAVAVSLWHHKMRTEPAFARQSPPIEVTIDFVSTSWPEQMREQQRFIERQPARCHVVRYEDLLGTERDRHLKAVLGFLEAPAGPDLLQAMWRATDFDALRERERQKFGTKAGFFRSGTADGWKAGASAEAIGRLERKAVQAMASFGYRIEA